MKKKMFYRMKSKRAQEEADRKCHAHLQEIKHLKEVTNTRLKIFHSALNMVKNVLDPHIFLWPL